jgi:hypothetical protein
LQRSGAAASQRHPSNESNSSDFKSNFAIPANVRSLPPHTVLQLPQIRFLIRRLNPRLLDLLPLVPLEHIPGLIGCLNELDVPRDIWVLMFNGLRDDPIEIWMKFMSRPQTSKLQIQLASEQPTSSESPNAPANEQPSDSDNAAHDLPQGAGGIELDRIAKNNVAEVEHQPGGIVVANNDPPAYDDGNQAPRPVAVGLRACQRAFLRTVGYLVLACLFGIWIGWFVCNLQEKRACERG